MNMDARNVIQCKFSFDEKRFVSDEAYLEEVLAERFITDNPRTPEKLARLNAAKPGLGDSIRGLMKDSFTAGLRTGAAWAFSVAEASFVGPVDDVDTFATKVTKKFLGEE